MNGLHFESDWTELFSSCLQVQARNVATKQNVVQATPTSLKNFYLVCEYDEKIPQLVHFLKVCTKEAYNLWA